MTTDSEYTGRLQGSRFVPVVSGNPAGKKLDTRHCAARLGEKLMAEDAGAVAKAVVAAAKAASAGRVSAPRIGSMIPPYLITVSPMCRVAPISSPSTPIGQTFFTDADVRSALRDRTSANELARTRALRRCGGWLAVDPRSPVAGAAALMCDDFDAQDIGGHAIEQRKGKTIQDQLAKNGVRRGADLGLLKQKIGRASDLSLETLAQPGDL